MIQPKKFAPYTKAQREKRRNEVYRLHFELGMDPTTIAELMKLDKNTINNDIHLLYKELRKVQVSFDDFISIHVARLESQRSRLFSHLGNVKEIDKKLNIERQIAEIDFKLLHFAEKLDRNSTKSWDKVLNVINDAAKELNLDYRVITLYNLLKVSPQAHERIFEILRAENVLKPGKLIKE